MAKNIKVTTKIASKVASNVAPVVNVASVFETLGNNIFASGASLHARRTLFAQAWDSESDASKPETSKAFKLNYVAMCFAVAYGYDREIATDWANKLLTCKVAERKDHRFDVASANKTWASVYGAMNVAYLQMQYDTGKKVKAPAKDKAQGEAESATPTATTNVDAIAFVKAEGVKLRTYLAANKVLLGVEAMALLESFVTGAEKLKAPKKA